MQRHQPYRPGEKLEHALVILTIGMTVTFFALWAGVGT